MNYKLFSFAFGLAASLLLASTSLADEVDCKVDGTEMLKTMTHEHTPLETTIMELERQTCRLIKAGEIDELMDGYIAEHGVILLDKGGVLPNRESQRTMFKEFLNAGFKIIYEPADAHVSNSEDMAWAIGAYELTAPDGSTEIGKYTSIWERIEGKWLNVIEMRNANE